MDTYQLFEIWFREHYKLRHNAVYLDQLLIRTEEGHYKDFYTRDRYDAFLSGMEIQKALLYEGTSLI